MNTPTPDTEPNYCIDTLTGAAHCITELAPAIINDLTDPTFPWAHAITAIIAFIAVM